MTDNSRGHHRRHYEQQGHCCLAHVVEILTRQHFTLERILMNQAELETKLAEQSTTIIALTEQVNKVLVEVGVASNALQSAIDALKLELATGAISEAVVTAVTAVDSALSELKVAVQLADDINPDAQA